MTAPKIIAKKVLFLAKKLSIYLFYHIAFTIKNCDVRHRNFLSFIFLIWLIWESLPRLEVLGKNYFLKIIFTFGLSMFFLKMFSTR